MNVNEWLFGNKLIWSHFATIDCNDWTSLIALVSRVRPTYYVMEQRFLTVHKF